MNDRVRKYIINHPGVVGLFCKTLNFINPTNTTRGKRKNTIEAKLSFRNSCKIRIEGMGNTILIEDFSRLINTDIYIHGNNNLIKIGKRCYLFRTSFYIEDSGNEIVIGEHTSIDGRTQFAAIEGTKILVGNDCMFSQNIFIRTGDAHSITNIRGKRINSSKNVNIGSHCWVGMNVSILKGSTIGDNSVIGAGSIVSGSTTQGHSILAGVPARIIKTNIDWCRRRIDDYEDDPDGEIDG